MKKTTLPGWFFIGLFGMCRFMAKGPGLVRLFTSEASSMSNKKRPEGTFLVRLTRLELAQP